MSATNRGSGRRDLDAYNTPDEVALRLVGALHFKPGAVVLEPHAGGGAFVRALKRRDVVVYANDIADTGAARWIDPARCTIGDFLDIRIGARFAHLYGLDWIVGNPPFSDAEAHIRHALTLAPNVAFLLRLAMLESAKRRALWAETPLADVHVLPERPSFTGGATDSAAYGLFVWRRGHVGPWRGHWLPSPTQR